MNCFLKKTLSCVLSTFMLSTFIQTPAQANISTPNKQMVYELTDNVYRGDGRHPTYIFENGFQVPGGGTNENMFDHIRFRSLEISYGSPMKGTTNFVSLSSSDAFPADWISVRPENQRWVYSLQPTAETYPTDISLQAAMGHSNPEIANEAEFLLDKLGFGKELLARGGVPREQIFSAAEVIVEVNERGQKTFSIDWENAFLNPYYNPSNEVPSSDPFPINEISNGCSATSKSVCNWDPNIPSSEEELLEVHLNNFGEELNVGLEETNFVFGESFVDGVRGRLKTPLQETDQLLAGFETAEGLLGFERLGEDLSKSVGKDLEMFNSVVQDEKFVGNVLESATRSGAFKTVTEKLPLIAVALTGYAMFDDFQTGNWVDLGFDSVAEILLAIDFIAPELAIFTTPLLVADMVVQMVVDYYRTEYDRHLKIHEWDQAQTQQDLQLWDAMPQLFTDIAIGESKQILLQNSEHLRTNMLLENTKTRLEADIMFLNQLQNAYTREINRQANRVVSRNEGVDRDGMEPVRVKALESVQQNFANVRAEKFGEYATFLQNYTQAAYEQLVESWHTGEEGFDHFVSEFDNNVVWEHINNMENLLWKHKEAGSDVDAVYGNKTRQQVREEKFVVYQTMFTDQYKNELKKIEVVDNTTENELLLRPPFVAPTLDVDHLHPVTALANSTVDVAGGVSLSLGSNGWISATVSDDNEQVNKTFTDMGEVTVNVYNSDAGFIFQRNSRGQNLGDPKVRQQFFANIMTVSDGGFIEFAFENPASYVQLGSSGASKIGNVSNYVVQREGNRFVPWIPQPLSLDHLHLFNNILDSTISVGGGVGLTLDADNGSFVVGTVDPETGLPLGVDVDKIFADSGKHVVTVYDRDVNGVHSFVRQYDSGGIDLGTVSGRQQFYEQISVVEDNQFLVFEFERSLSFVSVGVNNETVVDDVTKYVVQRKGNFFQAWLPYNLISDPVLQKTVNQQLGKLDLSDNVTQTDLLTLTELNVVDVGVQSLTGLEHATNLTALTVTGTQVTHLPQNFGQLKNLQSLVLSDNKLTQLPQSLADIVGLQKLNLDNNQLTTLPIGLAKLTNLVEVNVDNNLLADVSVFNQNIANFSAQNQTVNVVDGSHFFFDGFLQLHNVLLPTNRGGENVSVTSLHVSGMRCEVLDEQNTPVDYPDCLLTNDPSVAFVPPGYTLVTNIAKNSEQITVSFQDTVGNFSGDVVYSIREYVAPVPPTPPVFASVGVGKVEQNVDIKLPKSFGELVVDVSGLPAGLSVVSVNNELFLRGKTNSVGVFEFVVETTHQEQKQINFFSFETVSKETILVKVGETLDYRETFSYSTFGVKRAAFGQHSAGLLPAGVGFDSAWLNKKCLWVSLVSSICQGDSEISFTGLPMIPGTYPVVVDKRIVDYVFFQPIYDTKETKRYIIRVW